MRSDEAATWLIENYKIADQHYGEVFTLIPHRSWEKDDQLRLARCFLQALPFASGRPYEAFASFMPIRTLVKVIRECLPNVAPDRISLLQYYLCPLLRERAQTEADVRAGNELMHELKLAASPHDA